MALHSIWRNSLEFCPPNLWLNFSSTINKRRMNKDDYDNDVLLVVCFSHSLLTQNDWSLLLYYQHRVYAVSRFPDGTSDVKATERERNEVLCSVCARGPRYIHVICHPSNTSHGQESLADIARQQQQKKNKFLAPVTYSCITVGASRTILLYNSLEVVHYKSTSDAICTASLGGPFRSKSNGNAHNNSKLPTRRVRFW